MSNLHYKLLYKFGDTGINVNHYHSNAVLVIASAHGNSGDNTIAKMSLLRTGYDGNHLHEHVIVDSKSVTTYNISISLNDSKIYISGQNVVQPAILLIAVDEL